MEYSDKDKEDVFNEIFDRIEKGEALRNILKDDHLPCHKTFYKWLDEDKQRVAQYERACETRAEKIFEEILDIADNPEEGVTVTDKDGEVTTTTGDMLGHRRLKIDARKWMLGKMQPKKYGDKLDVTSKGEEIKGTVINLGGGADPEEEGK